MRCWIRANPDIDRRGRSRDSLERPRAVPPPSRPAVSIPCSLRLSSGFRRVARGRLVQSRRVRSLRASSQYSPGLRAKPLELCHPSMKTFTIAVIAGDGVGTEVIPQAKRVLEKVAQKTRRDLCVSGFRLGRGPLFPLGPHDAGGRDRPAAAVRRHSAGRGGASGDSRPHHAQRPAAADPPRVRSVCQCAAGVSLSRRAVAAGAAAKAATSISWSSARTPRASTRRWAASSTSTSRKRSRSRRRSSRAAASSGSCASPSNWRCGATRRSGSPRSRNRTRRATAWCCGTARSRDVAAEFPDIETESLLVDAAAMNFIRRPESFDVVVGSNLFCDILSDISAIIIGSMGLAASANLDPLRRFPSMFEPVHGSAPDIAGKGVVNPLATILSAAMMLEHLGMARCRARSGIRGRRGAGGREGAHARPGRQEQHRRSDGGRAGETGLVSEPRQRESIGRHAFLVGAGILLSRVVGLVRQRILLALLRTVERRGRVQRRRFAFPTFCRTCSARECSPHPSFRSIRGCWRRGTRKKRGRVAGAVCAILALDHVGPGAGGRAGGAPAHRCHCAGLSRREARTDHPPGADSVSRVRVCW